MNMNKILVLLLFVLAMQVGCRAQCVMVRTTKPPSLTYSEHSQSHDRATDMLDKFEAISTSLHYKRDDYSYISACYRGWARDEELDLELESVLADWPEVYEGHFEVKRKSFWVR